MKRGPRPELVRGDSPCEAHARLATVSFQPGEAGTKRLDVLIFRFPATWAPGNIQHRTSNIEHPRMSERLRRDIGSGGATLRNEVPR